VNDAKQRCEDAFDWTSLRGDDEYTLVIGDSEVPLVATNESHYAVCEVHIGSQKLKQVSASKMRDYYRGSVVADGSPSEWANYYDSASGFRQIRLYPSPAAADTLVVTRIAHQSALSAYDDVLRIPPQPVYLLASALASRERGELGGAPTSELFTAADLALSDAIARDAANFPDEQVWYTEENASQTNVGR